MEYMIPIRKVDAERRLVYGRAIEEIPDRSDEILDYESSKPLIQAWSDEVARATGGQSLGNIRVMHGKQVAGKITNMTFKDAERALDIVVKVVDDNEWRKVLEGCYTGFSIGGSYDKKWQDGKYTRYTANPTEISLVDRPCVPTAMFFEVVKADGLKEQRQFQNVEAFKPAMFNNLFKADDKKDGRAGRDADSDGKLDEKAEGSDARYYSQLVGGAAGGALGATAGMEAAEAFMDKPAANIGRKVEAYTRVAGRQAGLTQAVNANPATRLSGAGKSPVKAQAKLYGNLARMGVKGAVATGGMLIGGSLGDAFGDYVGRNASDKVTGEKGENQTRQGSLLGAVGGAILGTGAEVGAQLSRKTRMSTGMRFGRGFLGGTIGAIVGEMAGNYMDRKSGTSRLVYGAADSRFDRKMIGADTKEVGKGVLFGDLYKGTSLTTLAKYGTAGRDGDGDGQKDERANPDNDGLQSRSNVLGDTTTDEWTAERVTEGLTRNFGMVVGEMAGHAIGIPGLHLGGGAIGRFIGSAGGGIGGSAVGSQVGGEAGEVIDEKFGEKNPRPVERPVGTGEAIGRIGGALIGGWGAGIGAGLVAAPTGPGAIAAAIGAKTAGGFAGEEFGGMIGRLYDDDTKLEAPAMFDQLYKAGGATMWGKREMSYIQKGAAAELDEFAKYPKNLRF